MVRLILTILTLFWVVNCILCSRSRQYETDKRDNFKKHKSSKLTFNEIREINELTIEVESMNLNQMTVAAPVDKRFNDPLVEFYYQKIPFLKAYDLKNIFEEAIFASNFELIKIFDLHDQLPCALDEDYIESLCKSSAGESLEIIKFLIEKIPSVVNLIQDKDVFVSLLFLCADVDFEKFKFFWKTFNAQKLLSNNQLFDLICKITKSNKENIFALISETFSDVVERVLVFEDVLSECLNYSYYSDSALFLIKHGVSINSMNIDNKFSALFMAIRKNNFEIIKYIMKDSDVFNNLLNRDLVKFKAPWFVAIEFDHQEIIALFVSEFSQLFNVDDLIFYAMSRKKKKENVLRYFMQVGLINDQVLINSALKSIAIKDLIILKVIFDLGFQSVIESNDFIKFSLLKAAVKRDSIEIVSYLLEITGINVNLVDTLPDEHGKYITSTVLLFAASCEMIKTLFLHGADLNFNFIKSDADGNVLETTTLLHLAVKQSKTDFINYLVSCGVCIKITSNDGSEDTLVLSP